MYLNEKLSDMAAFVFGRDDGSSAAAPLLCQQIAKCAAYLIPCLAYVPKYNLTGCDRVQIRYFNHDGSNVTGTMELIQCALDSLRDVSAITCTCEVFQMEHPVMNDFYLSIHSLFNTSSKTEALDKYALRMLNLVRKRGEFRAGAWANSDRGIVQFGETLVVFLESLRYNDGDEPYLGQPVFFDCNQGKKSFGLFHSSVKSNFLVMLFAAAVSGNKDTCWISNNNVNDVLYNCFENAQDRDSQSKDHLHALEFRALGAFVVRCRQEFPAFELCPKNGAAHQALDCELSNTAHMLRKPATKLELDEFQGREIARGGSYLPLDVTTYTSGVKARYHSQRVVPQTDIFFDTMLTVEFMMGI